MASIRRFCLGIVVVLGCLFASAQLLSITGDTVLSHITQLPIDLEDKAEPSGDKQHENQLQEYKLNYWHNFSLERLYLNECAAFGQLDVLHSLEVFLEVVTPPPEA
jgi:hypothetical protein